jgi:protein subunit release factor A
VNEVDKMDEADEPRRVLGRDDVEVEVAAWSGDLSDLPAAVRLTHKETGLQAESHEHATQVANYDSALAQLERLLEEHLPGSS